MKQPDTPSPAAVRAQLVRLENSLLFGGSDRLMIFLRFVVTETLDGAGDTLKESVIGNTVYAREPAYDPRIDSTVRVEARRLRTKLQAYYDGEGIRDPIRITLPVGGYVPRFSRNDGIADVVATASSGDTADGANIFMPGPGTAIAIMPFRALGSDTEGGHFAEGLTDELMFRLVGERGFRIVSRLTAMGYWNAQYTPAMIVSELGVMGLLQGTVHRQGDVFRVLIEHSTPEGFVAFSDRFDVTGKDRRQLQEKIAMTFLSRIRFDSSKMRAMKISPGAGAVDAHAKVYRARQLLDRQTPAAIADALDLFQQVSDSAPDYARGHSGIADCYCDLFRLGAVDRLTAIEVARPAAQRAVDIDDASVEGHTALGTIAAWLERDRAAAEAHFGRARALGGGARSARIYGTFLTILRRHDEAEILFREARRIEPVSIQQDIAEACSHFQARRYQALQEAQAQSMSVEKSGEALVFTALSRFFGGDPAGAKALLPDIERADITQPDLLHAHAEIEAWLGEPDRGRKLIERSGGAPTAFGRATLAAALGEDVIALDALELAVDRLDLSTAWMAMDPRFDRLRDMPRFVAITDTLRAKLPQ